MRTSEQVFHQVRWDPRFDPTRFFLGINVRGAAPTRIPLIRFSPGGDIPWHRVLFVEADGELVWDRASGIDRIDSSTAGRVRATRTLPSPFFTPCTPHAWDPAAGWVPATPRDAVPPDGLRILTWNTLWDRYDSDRIDTAARRPLLIAALERADADVIALQEVERDLLDRILASDWVRAGYTIDTDPSGRDVDDSGDLLLSRIPVREAGRSILGRYKAVTAITLGIGTGPLVIMTAHLTSDHAENGSGRRETELTRVAEGLSGVDGQLVFVGDFNDSGDRAARVLGLRDAWTDVHGADDRTPTFDPVRNPLAAVGSLTGRAARLDRVLLRPGGPRAIGADLVGTEPVNGLFPSDHYGVAVDLSVTVPPADAVDLPPTARTAVAWIPPDELWPAIQAVRLAHDPSVDRWPPHVNLLFGFVPESAFTDAVPRLADAVTGIAPFTARLDGVRVFRHRDDSTVWLDPTAAGPQPWTALRHALELRFPRCLGRPDGYRPHLTLGRAPHPDRLVTACADRLAPVSARVGDLVVLSRRGTEPMRARAVVTLGTGEVRWLPDDAADVMLVDNDNDNDGGDVADRVRVALPGSVVHVVGSRRLGCALPGADIDLVAAVPGSVDLFAVQARIVASLADADAARPVTGARVPGLRWRMSGRDVDLVLVGTGDISPAEAVARRADLDAATAVAVSAVSDAEEILRVVPNVAELARTIKEWARVRGLDSAPFGSLPGIAWTVLAAKTVREVGDVPAAGLLHHFFGTWAGWDWRVPVTLTGDALAPVSAAMTILTPSYPIRSCTEQVSPGIRDLLTRELYRAWEGQDPEPMHRRHVAWAVVSVRSVAREPFEATIGRFRGRVRALLTALHDAGAADAHAWPRPFEKTPTLQRYAIGLGRTPPDADRLADVASGWVNGMPGARVDRSDGGEIPTLR